MFWLDVFSTYLFGLSAVVVIISLLMLVSGLDDLFIDIVYWLRRLWKSLVVYQRHERTHYHELYRLPEKPLAIMVPAWNETGVIGNMAELAATTLDYENYHIFVGTYPNDPDTQRDVDEVCARFPNVHKVVCARPGPTSKADCLNNVLDAILQFEQRARMTFEGFILHDAEDVVCALELRLFNYLVGRKDLIQIPVYPFARQWKNFTSLHYLDEFAELHGKDVPVREALAGQVPSAGVGTCFSRRAVLTLIDAGSGIAFDVQSLTEDYDIGLRLKSWGMEEVFVRFPVLRYQRRDVGRSPLGQSRRESNVICVREYFPDRLATAVRQKSRWIIGIVYQGYRTHGWGHGPVLNYFLWRDRKGAISNFVSFTAMLILLQLALVWLVQQVWPQAPRFLSIFEGHAWLDGVLEANLALMGNRMLQRIIFVSGYYGVKQGLLSIPRLLWGNVINFMANWRAIRQIIKTGDPRRVAWDKTTHDFPSIGGENRAKRSLGEILVANGTLSPQELHEAEQNQIVGLRLGSSMIHESRITAEQLARSTAEQIGVDCESVDFVSLPRELLDVIPARVALHYAVLPLRYEGRTLVLASESYVDPVSLAAIARQLDRKVRYVIAHKGQVAIGLRCRYAHARTGERDPHHLLDDAARSGRITGDRLAALWDSFVSRQVLLGEILVAQGHLDAVAFRSLLLSHARRAQPLGEFLVEQGVITRETLGSILNIQAALQPNIDHLLEAEAANAVRPVAYEERAMKRRWPKRCAMALLVMAPTWPLHAAEQVQPSGGSRYREFLVYPHRQAGYAALRAGNERTAIAEFARARELAPKDIDTAMDLVEAYRHFGHAAQARAVLEDQRRYTPNDPRLQVVAATAAPAVDCARGDSPACRAQRGFADLRTGDLAAAQAELDAADFARSPEGRALRHALVQRAIYLGDRQRAVAQLGELDASDKLSADERAQWFQLLLQLGQLDAARQLQSRGGLDAPAQDLAMAEALRTGGERKQLVAYMAAHQPAFASANDEQQWMNLLASAARDRPTLLARYTTRYPANAVLQARLSLPLAMARGDDAMAQRLLSRLPAGSFRDDRFSLDLQHGRYTEALQQAEMLIVEPDGHRLLDPLSYRLMEAGAFGQAKQLLLGAYPFAGDPNAAVLFSRVAVLAGEQPALFSAADRMRLRQPLETVPLRVAQVSILSALRDCDGIRRVMADLSPDYPAGMWRQLGDCYGSDRPGLAEYAYTEARKREPGTDITKALAYQAYSAQDYPTALQAWRSIPQTHMRPADLLAAATTALTLKEPAVARSWLDTYAAQGGQKDHDYWWLRAQADEPLDPSRARVDLENAVAMHADPRYYARLAVLQRRAGEPKQALVSLQHASALAPDDSRLAASLGYAYLQAGELDKAVAQLERAHQTNPGDPALTRQLMYLHQRLGDSAQAKTYAAQAIDQLDPATDAASGSSSAAQEDAEQQRYALRRLHEDLGRKWRFNADMTVGDAQSSAANAAAPGVSYRSYLQLEAQYRLDPHLTGGDANTLAAYARIFAGSGASGSVWPVHSPMLGVGLHWKPLISQNVVLTIEQQTPIGSRRDTRNDTMLRASGSWSFSPRFSDDWHATGASWFTQNFYIDVAHYLRARQTVLTGDYQWGWQLKLIPGQTIEPYAHVQYTGIDRSHGAGFARDARIGIGLQWNLWFGETRYDAYPHRFSVAVEGQHAFVSYLHENNALFLIARMQW